MPSTSKNNAPDEKTTKINEKGKRRISEEYTKINIKWYKYKARRKVCENIEKNNLDNILSKSD